MKRINPTFTSFARTLRKSQTDVEKLLWLHLRNKQIANTKFRRQHTIGTYIVDFVSIDRKLIIELDGGQHNENVNKSKDAIRDQWLKKNGYHILRFWNNDVLHNLENVLEMINKAVVHPHPDPLP